MLLQVSVLEFELCGLWHETSSYTPGTGLSGQLREAQLLINAATIPIQFHCLPVQRAHSPDRRTQPLNMFRNRNIACT